MRLLSLGSCSDALDDEDIEGADRQAGGDIEEGEGLEGENVQEKDDSVL